MCKKRINITIIGIVLIAFMGFAGCEDIAQNEIVAELPSPDGKYTAIAFIRDAGATTGFSPQVSVIKSDKSFEDKGGNVFIGNNSEYIDIKWVDSSTLKIFYDCDEKDIFKKAKKIYGITLNYETKK